MFGGPHIFKFNSVVVCCSFKEELLKCVRVRYKGTDCPLTETFFCAAEGFPYCFLVLVHAEQPHFVTKM